MARTLVGATSYESVGGLMSAMRMADRAGFVGAQMINGSLAIARGEGPVRLQDDQPEDEDYEQSEDNQEKILTDVASVATESSVVLTLTSDEEMKLATLSPDEEPMLAGV